VDGATSTDVAVVGAGVVGASVAYELACAGVDVALIDGARPGRASDAGAGIVSPETFHDPDEQWFAFATRAGEYLKTLVARLTEDGHPPGPGAYDQCGSLVVALAEHEDRWFAEVHACITGRAADVGEIDVTEARAMFPPLGRLWRALYSPRAARVDGRALADRLRCAARQRGAQQLSMEVVAADRRGDQVTALQGARGTHDRVECGAVVVAAGAWSAQVVSWFDAELPVAPTKGQIVHVVLPEDGAARGAGGSATWPIVQPVLNFYLVPWPGGRVACGGTFEADAGFDTRPTAGGLRDLLRECVAIAPGLAEATFSEVRVGLRPTSADERPLLGALPGCDNVHVCTGHGPNGLLLGPYSAALVASQVRGTSEESLPYEVSRL
jgi:D-amino-acid dehydrogenase